MSHRRRLLYGLTGVALVPLGVAGVILPLLPGIPILVVAAACLAVAARSGVSAVSGLGMVDRVKLDLLMGLRTVLTQIERRRRGGVTTARATRASAAGPRGARDRCS
jgi:uncharacterized protein YqgC (DUF456 family)